MAIAEECMKHKDLKACVVARVGKMINEEIRALCSDKQSSILRSTDPKSLCNFKCETVIGEMKEYAPTLLSILRECTKLPTKSRVVSKRRTTRLDQNAIIAVCTAILCKNRRHTMSLLQKIVSLILQAGRSSKQVLILTHNMCKSMLELTSTSDFQVFSRLHKLGLCTTQQTTLNTIDKLGENFDARVKDWQSKLLHRTTSSSHIQVS